MTCWFYALIAIPGRPRIGNEVEERIYARLLGRQQHLLLFAAVVTAITLAILVGMIPTTLDRVPDRAIPVERVCVDPQVGLAR